MADTVQYFGESWDVPMLEGAAQVPTPVGEPCGYCDEEVAEGEQGIMRTYVGAHTSEWRPIHRECDLRAVVGGVNHLKGTCTCHGGSEDPDPSWCNRRQAALLVYAEMVKRGMPA